MKKKSTNTMRNIDLDNEVNSWEYLKSRDSDEEETIDITGLVDIIDSTDISDIHVKIVPKREHSNPKIIEAKKKELEKMKELVLLKL